MKTILLMRHAKSSWDDLSLADFDRPLNERGEAAAPFMGTFIKSKGLVPDLILSSPAVRAIQTTKFVADTLGALTVSDERIYEATPEKLRDVTVELDETAETAMLVGHNPGLEGFLRYLTGEAEEMPTACVAVIETKVDDWGKLSNNCGRLSAIYRPRELMRKAAD